MRSRYAVSDKKKHGIGVLWVTKPKAKLAIKKKLYVYKTTGRGLKRVHKIR